MLRWFMCLDDAMDFIGLPIDDTGNDEGKAATRMLLLQPVAAVKFATMPIFEVTRQSVNLFSLEQAAPVTLAHVGVGHEAQGVFSADDTAKLAVGAVEMVLPREAIKSPECCRSGSMPAFQ